jgi:hypothetical protein
MREERSMPVTARLSKRFYDTFGDDITNELVDWFNKVDATYRTELRELNDLNFGRFDTKLGGLQSYLEGRMAALEKQLEARMAALESRLEARMAVLESRLEARMAGFEARLIKWMFLFWVGQAVTTVGLVFGVVRLVGR